MTLVLDEYVDINVLVKTIEDVKYEEAIVVYEEE